MLVGIGVFKGFLGSEVRRLHRFGSACGGMLGVVVS